MSARPRRRSDRPQRLLGRLDGRERRRPLVLLQPRFLLQPGQRFFSIVCRSARIISVSMTSISSRGETVPSTWTTSGSSNARMTWQIASASRMLARNLLPSPAPWLAPLTMPADVDERHRRRDDLGRVEDLGQDASRGSGTPTTPIVRLDRRERVVWPPGPGFLVRALNRVDLPTLGRPTNRW